MQVNLHLHLFFFFFFHFENLKYHLYPCLGRVTIERHILSVKDFSKERFFSLFERAEDIRNDWNEKEKRLNKYKDALAGKMMATLFWEPSTRTRMSFEAAMMHQGGRILGGFTAEGSSVKKGETIGDTIETICNYGVSVIVMRHKLEGAAILAAERADKHGVSIINGGDGRHEHPTQTLLDLYTMYREIGDLKGKKVALVGDLKNGRTPHSLTYGLGIFGADIYLVSPEQLKMPQEYISEYEKTFGKQMVQFEKLEDVVEVADVIYMTRIQKERFESPEEYEKVKGIYRMTYEMASKMKEGAILMHPLPRVDEIDLEVDKIPQAKYFEQVQNGWVVRAALLQELLEVEA